MHGLQTVKTHQFSTPLQVKPLADGEVNYNYMRDALLANASAGCRRASPHAYHQYADAYLTRARLAGGGLDWNYSRAAEACDAMPECSGFAILDQPRRGILPRRIEVRAAPQKLNRCSSLIPASPSAGDAARLAAADWCGLFASA